MINFPPGLILLFGAFLLPFIRGRGRDALVLILPLLTLAAIWMVPDGASVSAQFLDYTLTPVRATPVGRLFATVFAIMAFAGGLYALRQARVMEMVAAFAYAGSAIGVTFAGDLITLFVFWELMSVGSTVVLWSAGTRGAYRASMRYLMVHLMGGVLLMFGIIGHIGATGSVAFEPMQADSLANWLILIGFLINAGAPPLSAWVADAYPEASPSGAVFLSAFTTKTAVFALLVAFPGTWVLIPVGLYMAFYGIIYALLENDMRRVLAYSIVNQVGFMVIGIGIGTELALNGAAAHAFAHIIYKGLLLMSAGSVLYQTGERRLSHLGGLFRTMPVTAFLGIIGALAISAFPFTSGFVSKSMVTSSAAEQHMTLVWLLMQAAAAGVFLHAGIKFPWFVFFQKDSGLRPAEPPANMRIAMWVFAFFCIALGVYPAPLYNLLPFPVDYAPYTAGHLVASFQLLLFAGLAFFVMLPLMKRTLTITLDFDWFYRHFGALVGSEMMVRASQARRRSAVAAQLSAQRFFVGLDRYHGPTSKFASTWPTGSMVLWVAILLGAYLVFGFL
ncbi:MAG TPA: Na(+)/H(+) antiporter subunit D [Longimicrobiaceae bacterium]|nr:Na(+)/H(+) antiporter subunit D [Longimicrobiaceae bacterium]